MPNIALSNNKGNQRMNITAPSLPVNRLTYSQRKRLINLLKTSTSNLLIPFILGFVLSLISVTHTFVETFTAFDKSGFGVCLQPELPVRTVNP